MGIFRLLALVFAIGEQVGQLPGTGIQGLGRGLRHRLQDRLWVWGVWQHQLPAGLQHQCCQGQAERRVDRQCEQVDFGCLGQRGFWRNVLTYGPLGEAVGRPAKAERQGRVRISPTGWQALGAQNYRAVANSEGS